MSEHVVVTGGAGFIGSCLIDELLATGHKVTAVDRVSGADAPRLAAYRGQPSFREVRLDIGRSDDLDACLAGAQTVFHLSGNTENRSDKAARHADLNSTVVGTIHLLDALVRTGAATRVVMTSSQLVYDPSGVGDCTDLPLRPRSMFGAGKLAAEAFLSAYSHECGFRGRVCRLANIIGPSFRRGIVYDFVRRLHQDPTRLQVLGDGSQRRSFLAVDDCVQALVLAGRDASSGAVMDVFDVSNVDTMSALDVATVVAEECPRGLPRITVEGAPTAWRGDVGSVHVPPTQLTALGWAPQRGSVESVRITAQELFRQFAKEDGQ